MSSTWSQRIAEGLVIGISASVMIVVFNSMNDARSELTKARKALNIQTEVNQGLLDKTDAMETRMMRLDSRIERLMEIGPLFGPRVGSAPPPSDTNDTDTPSEGSDPSEVPSVVSETSHTLEPENLLLDGVFLPLETNRNLQDRINQQRVLNR